MWDPSSSATGPTLRAWHVSLVFGYICSVAYGWDYGQFCGLDKQSEIAPQPFAISKRLMVEINCHLELHFYYVEHNFLGFFGSTGNLW